MKTARMLVAATLILTGCSGDGARFAVAPETSQAKIRSTARTVEVVQVSLPAYAKAVELSIQDASGALVQVGDATWADDPDRAMTNGIVRNLSAITGVQVAAEPWPLDGNPEAEVRVRVEEMLVAEDGVLRLSGQFAIRRDVVTSRNRIRPFSITVPSATTAPTDILAAHERAWAQLAESIAKEL